MSLVMIFGPPAVGKMAVGHELAKLTGLKLFHNHATIEMVLPIFPFDHPAFARLVGEMRRRVMEEVAASDLPGLIFTYVWALDDPSDKAAVDRWTAIFEARGREVLFVELEASQAARLERDGTVFRLSEKPSKRDRVASVERLLAMDQKHKLNSTDEFSAVERYLRIDNTERSPVEVAVMIRERFGLPSAG